MWHSTRYNVNFTAALKMAEALSPWLLSREEITQSPSRVDGVSYEAEVIMRNSAITQLGTIGQKRDIKKQIIATACVLFHRFFSRRSMKRFDRSEVALACLIIAGKTVEFQSPVMLFKPLINERLTRQGVKAPISEDSEQWKATKEQLVLLERQVLSCIEFDVAVDLPFHYVEDMCSSMGLTPVDHPLRTLAIKFLNDLLKTTLVLQYDSSTLAFAALLFAREQLDIMSSKRNGPPLVLPPTWHTTVVLAPEIAQAITAQFSEAMLIVRKEAEKHQAKSAATAAAAPAGTQAAGTQQVGGTAQAGQGVLPNKQG